MKLKRIIAMLATFAMMATMLFGCGKPSDNKTTEAPADKTTVSGEDNATTEAPTEAKPVYPLEGNPTVTIWSTISEAVKANGEKYGYKTLEERPYAKELMRLTGINVDWITPSSSETHQEEFEMMLANKNYTDLLQCKGTQVEQYYADGVIIRMDDVIDQYMPNFKAYLDANPDIAKILKAPDGHFYQIPLIMEDASLGNTFGVFCRQDWLDELNIQMPTTIDEWHDALVKIKDAKGNAPIVMSKSGELYKYGAFLNAFCPDRSGGNFHVEDGKVTYINTSDGMRDLLKVLNQWFEEGLIHPDFAAMGSTDVRAYMSSGKGFMSAGYAGSSIQNITNAALETDKNFKLTAVATAEATKGVEPKYQSATPRVGTTTKGTCISTKCENVEAAARLIDFYFTEEGYMLNNFGIEGTTYTKSADGKVTYTDHILKNPDGLAVNEAMAGYMVNFEGGGGLQAVDYLLGYYSATPAAAAAPGIWSSKGEVDFSMRLITHTVEENDDIKLYSEVDKTADKALTAFITGAKDIDTEWDAFVKEIEGLGLAELLKIKQAAYDRYVAK